MLNLCKKNNPEQYNFMMKTFSNQQITESLWDRVWLMSILALC